MDRGRTWTAISGDLTRSPLRGNVPFGTLTTVAESKLEFGLIWAGTDDGYVHRTESGGFEWTDVSNGLPADRWVTRVEPSRVERDRCYVSFSGYRDDDIAAYVFVTEDLGRSWRSISEGLPAEAVNVVREDPHDPDVLWVGTDRGVYVSLDRGEAWHALPTELPNVAVHDLTIHERDRDVVIGTHGRSAWILDAEPIETLTDKIRESELHLWKKDSLRASRGWGSEPSKWFPSRNDGPSTEFTYWSKVAGPVTATILDREDRVLRTFEAEALVGVNVLEWDLLLDPELAIAVEEARVAEKRAKREADEDDEEGGDAEKEDGDGDGDGEADGDAPDAEFAGKGELAETPWAEALRLGRRLAVTKGKYRLRLERGEASVTLDFEIR